MPYYPMRRVKVRNATPTPQQSLGILYGGRVRLKLVVACGGELVGSIFDGSDIMLLRQLAVGCG